MFEDFIPAYDHAGRRVLINKRTIVLIHPKDNGNAEVIYEYADGNAVTATIDNDRINSELVKLFTNP